MSSFRITITFDEASSGVACNLDSRGFHVLCKATEEVVGHVKPYSITGTLPLIRELQVGTLFLYLVFGNKKKTGSSLTHIDILSYCRMRALMCKLLATVYFHFLHHIFGDLFYHLISCYYYLYINLIYFFFKKKSVLKVL